MDAPEGSELVVTRAVSKTVNPGSNPGSPVVSVCCHPHVGSIDGSLAS